MLAEITQHDALWVLIVLAIIVAVLFIVGNLPWRR